MSPLVLVVEDNRVNMELTVDLLELAGYRILTAPDAMQGIEIAKQSSPDLILMDIGLPGMDGLQATRVLKAMSETQAIPVVALTANAMKGDDAKAAEAGCAGYITKPIDTREFPNKVAKYLQKG